MPESPARVPPQTEALRDGILPGHVLPLGALGRGDVLCGGGKAANLGEMIRAGLPVPDGFCVTCDAYRSHVEAHGLDGRIAERLRAVDEASPGALEAAAAEARAWIAGAAPSSRIAGAIAAAYGAMGGEAVAVRSSATTEDLADASFAFKAFPRLRLAALLWEGDEDFPAEAHIVFDAVAGHYLPAEDLAGLGEALTRKLTGGR